MTKIKSKRRPRLHNEPVDREIVDALYEFQDDLLDISRDYCGGYPIPRLWIELAKIRVKEKQKVHRVDY